MNAYRGSNSFTAPFARYEYQIIIDIMVMAPLSTESEVKITPTKKEPTYALVVIDIFSKYADVLPMKENNSESILEALNQAFKKIGFPMSIYSDNDVRSNQSLGSCLMTKAYNTSSRRPTQM